MRAAGIVAEYNPFHNGHLHHLLTTKKITGLPVIAVMSGSLVQRGEVSFMDKWTRASLAAACGADLVLELPTAFVLRSAEFFASGAVKILQATGCVDTLSCGCEHNTYDFSFLARFTAGETFKEDLRAQMRSGLPYAAAQQQALQKFSLAGLNAPNDILALEYSRALLDTSIKPLFIQRAIAGYNDAEITSSIASATAVRAAWERGDFEAAKTATPAIVARSLQNKEQTGCNQNLLWQLINYQLRLLSSEEISNRCQCTEGLENLLKQAVSCSSLEQAVRQSSNKRYPASRIRRLFLQLLLQKPRSCFEENTPAYLRVLAFNDTGRKLLKTMKHTAALPIIIKTGRQVFNNRPPAFCRQLNLDMTAADIAALLRPAPQPALSDYLLSPVYQKTTI